MGNSILRIVGNSSIPHIIVLPQRISWGLRMAYKVSVIVLMVTLVYLTLKYWRAKEEKDNCYVNLDGHIKFIKENDKNSKQSKDTFEKLVYSRETEISDLKEDKSNAESKLKLCESSGTSKDKEMRIKEASLVDKDAALSDKNKDLDEMIEKYGRLKSENDLLETHLSNSKDEIETLEDKVKDAVIQAKDDQVRLDAALSAKKDIPKEKAKVNDLAKAINKVVDPIIKPSDNDEEEDINRKAIDEEVEKKDKVLSDKLVKDQKDIEEDEEEN